MRKRRWGAVWAVALLLLIGCGPSPESSRPASPESSSPAAGAESETGALEAVPVEPQGGGQSAAAVASASMVKPADPAERFGMVSNLWVELDGEYARVKFTVELENQTSDTARPAFLSIEQHNWVAREGRKHGVGGGTIGIRRALDLAPGERAFMHRGDFTTLGASEFRRGAYAGAGFSGAVTLQTEDGTTFQLPFDHAVKFSMDENDNPLTEVWADPPEGTPVPPAEL